MKGNTVLNGNEYARREVRSEESSLMEQSFTDFGWECVRQENLGGGKTALYFRREKSGDKKQLDALQKECEKLIRDVERIRKNPSELLSFATLMSGIVAAYFIITGIIAAILGGYIAAGGFAGAGLLLLLTACVLTIAAPGISGRAQLQIGGITENILHMREQAKKLRKGAAD